MEAGLGRTTTAGQELKTGNSGKSLGTRHSCCFPRRRLCKHSWELDLTLYFQSRCLECHVVIGMAAPRKFWSLKSNLALVVRRHLDPSFCESYCGFGPQVLDCGPSARLAFFRELSTSQPTINQTLQSLTDRTDRTCAALTPFSPH